MRRQAPRDPTLPTGGAHPTHLCVKLGQARLRPGQQRKHPLLCHRARECKDQACDAACSCVVFITVAGASHVLGRRGDQQPCFQAEEVGTNKAQRQCSGTDDYTRALLATPVMGRTRAGQRTKPAPTAAVGPHLRLLRRRRPPSPSAHSWRPRASAASRHLAPAEAAAVAAVAAGSLAAACASVAAVAAVAAAAAAAASEPWMPLRRSRRLLRLRLQQRRRFLHKHWRRPMRGRRGLPQSTPRLPLPSMPTWQSLRSR